MQRVSEPDAVQRVPDGLSGRAGVLEQRTHRIGERFTNCVEPGLIRDCFERRVSHKYLQRQLGAPSRTPLVERQRRSARVQIARLLTTGCDRRWTFRRRFVIGETRSSCGGVAAQLD
jgi:hypothetical protein